MSIKKSYICLSTKYIYSSVILILLGMILFILFPLNELLVKRNDSNKIPVGNPIHTPPPDTPTPTIIQKILFPNNPDAERGMKILRNSKYGHPSYKLYSVENAKEYFDENQQPNFFLEFLGINPVNQYLYLYKITYPVYPIYTQFTEKYEVNIETKEVVPIFPTKNELETILDTTSKQIQIPGTNKSIILPSQFLITVSNQMLSFSQTNKYYEANLCLNRQDEYCKEFREYLGSLLQTFGDPNKLLSVGVRTIKWAGTPHEWALDNVGWQGRTLRETLIEYPDFSLPETVTIGNNDFYKIGEGCCGDRTYSYITKGFDGSGTSLLIIFQATGEQKTIDEKENRRTIPYLEEILKTMN